MFVGVLALAGAFMAFFYRKARRRVVEKVEAAAKHDMSDEHLRAVEAVQDWLSSADVCVAIISRRLATQKILQDALDSVDKLDERGALRLVAALLKDSHVRKVIAKHIAREHRSSDDGTPIEWHAAHAELQQWFLDIMRREAPAA